MERKKKTSIRREKSKAPSGSIREVHYGSLIDTFNHVHREIVSHCQICGKPMSRSDVNDWGSLCEVHWKAEYKN